MARTVADANLGTRAARAKLAAGKKPYYRTIEAGRHVGYYKGARGGSWTARRFLGNGKYEEAKLGTADDTRDADGIEVLNFSQAQAKARDWFEQRTREAVEAVEAAARLELGEPDPAAPPYTVSDAITDYLAEYRRKGGKSLAEMQTRIDAFISPSLGTVEVERLTTQRIKDWLEGVATSPARLRSAKGSATVKHREIDPDDDEAIRKRRATANRTLTVLKAALNFAFAEGKAPSDLAWRRVKPYREADAPKVRYLSPDERKCLLNTLAGEFKTLVLGALLTGCRYGELAAMRCGDFDSTSGTVHVAKSKSGKARHVVLSDDGRDLFASLTAGRARDALIFSRADGGAWGKSHQHRPLIDACDRAKIAPAISFHILRHTYATALVQAGVPLGVIASNLGHADTRMTERHYAHMAPSYVAETIRAAMPRTNSVDKSTVTALRQA